MNSREAIIALVIKYNAQWDDVMHALTKREEPEEEYYLQYKKMKCNVVTILDPEYPVQLKHVVKPPLALFYYGDLNILSNYYNNISVVGSRDCSEYGERITTEIAGDLAAKGYVIVSGLAKGIDATAHKAAIDRGGKTVAVLGTGIDHCYPSENLKLYWKIKKDHLLISEYPRNASPEQEPFPYRNRLIAGLSKTLVVTEAKYQSGSLITVTFALNGNADVMCVPHRAGEQSECNRLIMKGAIMVENANDVIEEMSKY
ncbi:MAG: DNA-processing protein DprA [Bacilli bacterium]|nr:DNA-processing protein DprA [Bacilli bacterium]